MTDVDYDAIEIPDEEEVPPTEWNHYERRAELLEMVVRAGGPHRLPRQSELAKRYGVVQQTISKDLDRLAEHIEAHIGEDILTRTETVYQRVFDALMQEGRYQSAWQVHEGYERVLQRRGVIPQVPSKHEVTQRQVNTESDDYEILTDDGDIRQEEEEEPAEADAGESE